MVPKGSGRNSGACDAAVGLFGAPRCRAPVTAGAVTAAHPYNPLRVVKRLIATPEHSILVPATTATLPFSRENFNRRVNFFEIARGGINPC
jgi:hypothetical protein